MFKGLIASLLVVFLLGLSLGEMPISLLNIGHLSDQQYFVLWNIRVPRVIGSALVGAGLAVSGVALQALFRNPLADAGLIGVSSASALGAVIVLVIFPWLMIDASTIWLSFSAFMMALAMTSLLYYISTQNGQTQVAFMLLAGVALNALAASLTALLVTLSTDTQMRNVIFWMMGSFSGLTWSEVIGLGIVLGASLWAMLKLARQMDLYLLGETVSQQMGQDPKKFKIKIMAWSAFMVGVSVSMVGMIGFVGLVVPHIMRLWVGVSHQRLLPASALGGAILMGLADILSRTLVPPLELPVGLIMALIGSPFFLWLLWQKRRGFV